MDNRARDQQEAYASRSPLCGSPIRSVRTTPRSEWIGRAAATATSLALAASKDNGAAVPEQTHERNCEVHGCHLSQEELKSYCRVFNVGEWYSSCDDCQYLRGQRKIFFGRP